MEGTLGATHKAGKGQKGDEENVQRPTVVILTSDAAFARQITANWPRDATLHSPSPEFIVLDENFSIGLANGQYSLAIADASSWEEKITHSKSRGKRKLTSERSNNSSLSGDLLDPDPTNSDPTTRALTQNGLTELLAARGRPAIVIHSVSVCGFCKVHGSVIALRREPKLWPAVTGLIGREILRRQHAESRACEAGQICAAAQAEATLGRYMVEMRTNITNALTTVLGNAELLAHEPNLPAPAQAQADAIRDMAMRLNEIFQRFSSIETELRVAAREPGKAAARATGLY